MPQALFDIFDSRWTVLYIGLIILSQGEVFFFTVRKASDPNVIAFFNMLSGIVYFLGFSVFFNLNLQADQSGIDYWLMWILFILSAILFVGSSSNLGEKDSLKGLKWLTLIASIIALLPFYGIEFLAY